MKTLFIVLGAIMFIATPILLVIAVVKTIRKKKTRRLWVACAICCVLFFAFELIAADKTETKEINSTNETSQITDESFGDSMVDNDTISSSVSSLEEIEEVQDIETDGIAEKLMALGMSAEEADKARTILLTCGINSIDVYEPIDPKATVDGLMVVIGKLDENRTAWFTIDNREIFYVALNGEDLYDTDKGGFLKHFDEVHIPETYISDFEKIALREKTESLIDRYMNYDIRWLDAWSVAREDDSYMVQCQMSDGSILTDNWIICKAWYEKIDSEFVPTAVQIGTKYYSVQTD